jgi:hypothetical protein
MVRAKVMNRNVCRVHGALRVIAAVEATVAGHVPMVDELSRGNYCGVAEVICGAEGTENLLTRSDMYPVTRYI